MAEDILCNNDYQESTYKADNDGAANCVDHLTETERKIIMAYRAAPQGRKEDVCIILGVRQSDPVGPTGQIYQFHRP